MRASLSYLDQLESQSIFIIREAFARLRRVALLWSIGKDSTTLLWLVRKAFLGKIPFPVIHIDTGRKFKEIYVFRDKMAAQWDLDLRVVRNEDALARGTGPAQGKFQCCTALKTEALRQEIRRSGYRGLYLAIRRDEHGIRAKERCFSPRTENFEWNYKDQPAELWDQYKTQLEEDQHLRIHPLLGWREIDVWEYIQREKIPATTLYFSKNGMRFRSIGCECCCDPVDSQAATVEAMIEELRHTKISERSGRSQDKESDHMMQRLRALGYM